MIGFHRGLVGFALASVLATVPAMAHHSGAMFDDRKSVPITGKVKVFQWTNPHCWIQVLTTQPGGDVEWSVEMGSPGELYRRGWRPGTLKAGDQVTLVIHPMRDGTPGGLFVSGNGANGRPLGIARALAADAVQP